MLTKVCTSCKEVLEANLELFHKAAKGKYGLAAKCKKCRSQRKPIKEPKTGHKFCGKCLQELPLSNSYFRENGSSTTGYFSYCLECEKDYKKQYRVNNSEKIKERDRRYYQLNKGNKKEYDAVYRKENKIRISAYSKKYYSINKTELDKKNELWRKNNPLRYKEISRIVAQRRLARKRKLPANFTGEQWEMCKMHFDYSCAYCGSESNLEQEHFIPLSKGGEYTKDNIIPACDKCNPSKNDKRFEDWYTEQHFYSKSREIKILKYLGYKENIQQLTLL